MRHGHNAVHRSPDGALIAKVYGESSRCDVEVGGAVLAREAGVSVPELISRPQPRVAVWRRIPSVQAEPDADALVRLAGDIGRLATLPDESAPVHWLVNVAARASALESLLDERRAGRADIGWLAAELRAVAASDIATGAPITFQHGDLTMANLVHDGRRLHIIDFETIRAAPPEWDVAALTVSARRYGGLGPAALRVVLDALAPAPDPVVLKCCVRTKELLNTSWLYLIRDQDPELVAEAGLRVRALRDGRPHRWRDLDALASAQTAY